MRLDRPIGTWLLYWPCAWSVALAGVRRALGPVPLAGCSAPSRCAAPAASTTTSSTATSTGRSSEPACARWPAGGCRLRSAWVLIGSALRWSGWSCCCSSNVTGGSRRAGQHRAGRRLSLHEADHLVAAGVARPGVLLGRAGRLAGGDRSFDWPPLLLWFGSIAWVVGYDTLYAIQDIEDDALVGVKSLGAAARRQGRARRGYLLCARAASLGRGDLDRSGPTGWRCSTLLPAALHLANQALRVDPERRRARASPVPLEPHLRPARLPRACWSSGCRRARRGAPCSLPNTPATSPNHWSSAASPPAPTRPMPSTSAIARSSVQVRLGELEDVSRSEGEEIGLRLFVGQRSATVASSDLSDEALATLVERCLAMAAEAPEDPYAGLAPPELLAARRPARARIVRSARARPAAASRTRARSRESGARRCGRHQLERRRRERIGLDDRARDLRRVRRRLSHDRPRLLCPVVAGRGRSMQRDHAWHSARILEDLEDAPNRPPCWRARGRAAESGAAEAGQIAGPVRSARFVNPARPFCRRRSAASSVARKTSFLQDRLGEQVFAPRRDDPRRSVAHSAACARGHSTAKGCAVARHELVANGMLTSWIAESASARQLGIQPTGHAVRGAGGAPGASPTNLYMAAGKRSRETSCSRPFPKPCWSPS